MLCCPICTEEFTSDFSSSASSDDKSHLPVQSRTCSDVLCYSCILKWQLSESEGRQLRKWVSCPFCREKQAHRVEKPIYCRVMFTAAAAASDHTQQNIVNKDKKEETALTRIQCDDVDEVLLTMEEHSDYARVQEQGCWVLMKLAYVYHDDHWMILKKSARWEKFEKDGIGVILEAMQKHSSHAGVQYAGCGVLRKLAGDYGYFGNLIAEGKGIQLILSAMREHSSHASIQYEGCGALQQLPKNHGALIVKSGGLEMICSAMLQHSSHVDVQCSGCDALGSLAHAESEDVRKKIEKSGSIDAVFQAMQQHTSHADIQYRACEALGVFVWSWCTRKQLVAKGAVEMVEMAQRNHPNDSRIQEQSKVFLDTLKQNMSRKRPRTRGPKKEKKSNGPVEKQRKIECTIGISVSDKGCNVVTCRNCVHCKQDCQGGIVRCSCSRRNTHETRAQAQIMRNEVAAANPIEIDIDDSDGAAKRDTLYADSQLTT